MRYKSNVITNCTLIFGMGALLFHLMALSYLTALSFSTVINIPDWGSLLLLNTVGKDSKVRSSTPNDFKFKVYKCLILLLNPLKL